MSPAVTQLTSPVTKLIPAVPASVTNSISSKDLTGSDPPVSHGDTTLQDEVAGDPVDEIIGLGDAPVQVEEILEDLNTEGH